MQKKIWLWALILGAIMAVGNGAWAQSDFYVIAAGPTAVGTKITSVPYTISSAGFYYLTGNLSYSGAGNAITVNADGVTLDLMGFRLGGPGATSSAIGIYMSGRVNVEVRNGTVGGFNTCVNEHLNGNKHRVINVRTTDNSYGILLDGKNHMIKNCSASNSTSTGLWIAGSGLIVDSVANDNGYGISLFGPGSVLGNTACNNANDNFYLGNGVKTGILVDRNSAFGGGNNLYNDANPLNGVVITANNSGL